MRLEIKNIEKSKDKLKLEVSYIENKEKNIEFYPDGKGGQLGDRGFLFIDEESKLNKEIINIVEVDRDGNLIINNSDEDKVKLGEYNYSIDMKRRDEIAKGHSTQHMISAYLKKEYNYDTVGFRMGEEYSTVDFPTLELIDNDKIRRLEVEINKMIIKNMKIKTVEYTREEAEKIESLRKGISDKIVGNIKVVEIENFDINACGGFHVEETKEIGLFKVVNYEKLKKTMTRVYYKSGIQAYEDMYDKHDYLKKASGQLSVTIEDVNKKIDQILEENKSKSRELSNLYNNYAELACENLKKNAKDIKENKVIVYEKNDGISKLFPKYIDIKNYSVLYGENNNYTVLSDVIDCRELKKVIEEKGYIIRGGGKSNRINLQGDIKLEIIVDIFTKLL